MNARPRRELCCMNQAGDHLFANPGFPKIKTLASVRAAAAIFASQRRSSANFHQEAQSASTTEPRIC